MQRPLVHNIEAWVLVLVKNVEVRIKYGASTYSPHTLFAMIMWMIFSSKTIFSAEFIDARENFHAWIFVNGHWISDFYFLKIQFLQIQLHKRDVSY